MKNTNFILLAMAVMMAVFASACGGTQAAPTAAPAPTQAPPPAAPVEAPTQQQQVAQPAPTTQVLAPVCQNTTSACIAPDNKDSEATNTYCVKKIPYTNISVPNGTTFEVLDKSGDYICADSGTFDKDGKRVITCHGKQLYSFDLKLTNPACGGGSNLVTGTGQCQDGYGFDAAQGCCAPVSANATGSVTIKVNLGGCP